MKRMFFLCVLFCLMIFSTVFAQQRVKVNRWVSPVFKDFISIPENKSTDAQLISFGYKDKIFQYEAFLTRPEGNNVAVVNRWSHPNCGDFIIIAEQEISDQQMTSFGYVNKQFLFYAYKTRPASGAYVAVSRWVNTLPVGNPCRDFSLSIAEHELTDAQLTSWGYTEKKVQFYVPDPRFASPTITLPPGALITRLNTQLTGYVDMHTHPMSHLGFGGKLIHGAPDVDILVPAIPSGNGCRHYTRAANINEALCSCKATHGGYGIFDNTCGDDLRKAILRSTEGQLHARTGHHEEGAQGFPAFSGWPAYNDITHQQMWIDWIKRTYENGLRVMVALTVNNATLAAAVSGPGDRNPDDVSSSNIQIDEMKRMVARHNGSAGSVDDWMEIAYTASDIRRIVSANKLAIILGMEVDNIGNFNKNSTINPNSLTPATTQVVRSEIQRIYNQGVRYIFPIHLVDNKFGGTAVYEDMFNLSNYHQSGRHWDIVCANPADGITKKFVVAGFDAPLAAAKAKIGVDAFRNPPTPPNCSGHVNNLGLTPLGEYAIKEMMKLGMMIDIDHMSKKSMDKTLEIANNVTAGGYPLNAGHNGIRTGGGSERSLSLAQAQTIMRLGGVIGVGCSKTKAYDFVGNFLRISGLLGGDNARLAIGTDINGFEQGPPPTPGSNLVIYDASFPMCTTGNKSWNYNTVGVAHYGLLPDFFKDVQTTSYGIAVYEKLMKSAEYFAQMWEKCERQKTNVR